MHAHVSMFVYVCMYVQNSYLFHVLSPYKYRENEPLC